MKRALSVGINYPNSPHRLRGCVNDSHTIVKMLKENYGFKNEEITVILDEDATAKRIREELIKLVSGTKPGDIIFFHYSGHGTQIMDDSGDEVDGLDEVICPVDFDWSTKVIRDDELRRIFNVIPYGVNATIFLDCCNSGGGLNHVNEYQSTGLPESRTFDPAIRFIPPPKEIADQIDRTVNVPKKRNLARAAENHSIVLISGARAHQTAADAHINGKYQGATTHYLYETVKQYQGKVTYKQIADHLNDYMIKHRFTQRPQLDGPEAIHSRMFLSEYDFGNPEDEADIKNIKPASTTSEPVDGPPKVHKPTVTVDSSQTVNVKDNKKNDDDDDEDDTKDKMKLIYGAIGVAIVAGVIFFFGGY